MKMNNPIKLVVIGAGGHAKVVIEAIRAASAVEIVGLIDPAPTAPGLFGLDILGGDELLPELRAQGVYGAVIALGGNALREKIGNRAREFGLALPTIVHPSALLSPSAKLGDGVVVMANAIIGTDTIVGELAIVNTGAIIDHDNILGVSAHVAPGCAIAGNVRIGRRTLIGVGSAVRPGIHIGDDAVIGAGSGVVSDVGDGQIVGGVPARALRQRRVQ